MVCLNPHMHFNFGKYIFQYITFKLHIGIIIKHDSIRDAILRVNSYIFVLLNHVTSPNLYKKLLISIYFKLILDYNVHVLP